MIDQIQKIKMKIQSPTDINIYIYIYYLYTWAVPRLSEKKSERTRQIVGHDSRVNVITGLRKLKNFNVALIIYETKL